MVITEIKKLFHTKLLYISIALGLFACLLGLFSYHENAYFLEAAGKAEQISSYQAWLECLSLGSSIYRLIFPLLIVPYIDSYFNERKSGYINFSLPRTKKRKYFFTKWRVGVFSAAGIAAVILILTLLVCMVLFPENQPVMENTYINYPAAQALFISKPLVFIGLTIVSNMFLAAVYYTLGFSFSCYAKNRYAVLLAPFVIFLIQLLLSQLFFLPALSPLAFIAFFELYGLTARSFGCSALALVALSLIALLACYHKESHRIA